MLEEAAPGSSVVELLNVFDASYSFVGNEGPVFWFQTDLDAPKGRVIAIDTTKPDPKSWTKVIPEHEEPLRQVSLAGNRMIARSLQDAHSVARVYETDGRFVRDVELPGLGTVFGLGGRKEDVETFYLYTSFTTPITIYHYNVATGESSIHRAPQVDFDPAAYQTDQIFYESTDGTHVPMFISHRRGFDLDGNNPMVLNGYGGFRAPMVPFFTIPMIVWMEMGGVFAVAGVRGGMAHRKRLHTNREACDLRRE